MGYSKWVENHAIKHKAIIEKLVKQGYSKKEIIDYFDFENMKEKEKDFCPLYAKNKKCHDMEKLNCYLCSCPNFRFKDEGIEKVEDKTLCSTCSIESKDGRQGIYGEKIHQDCSKCGVPHHRAYVEKHFDLDWAKNYETLPTLMGVKTAISLKEVNLLFGSYKFTHIEATSNGIMDTTYILKNNSSAFILKKYERDVSQKICMEKELLQHLATCNLNTPRFLVQNKEWYLYTKLQGEMPKSTQLFHIRSLARFLSTLHKVSKTFTKSAPFLEQYDINLMLTFAKKHHFYYYKKLFALKNLHLKNQGFIHGDIFKDNTLFEGNSIAVFDFIDGGLGEFSFDIAVALLSFNPKNRPLHVKSFLKTYNQNSRQKIPLKQVQKQLKIAAKFYALLRINHDKKTKRAKELCNR